MKKAIASIINKITKVSVSTALFWLGCFVAVLAAGLQWIMPGNQLVLFLVAVGGVVLAGSQKVFGDREHDRKFEQERRIRGAREQYIYDRTPEGRHKIAINQLRASMDKGRHQQTTQ